MFTQCPECQTIFELGIEDLKAAEGQVCCGECDKVFNALASLTDLPDDAVLEARNRRATDKDAEDETGPSDPTPSGDLFEDDEQAGEAPDRADDEPLDEADDENDEAGPEAEKAEGADEWAPDGQVVPEQELQALERNRWEQKLAELGLAEQESADAGADTPDSIETANRNSDNADQQLADDGTGDPRDDFSDALTSDPPEEEPQLADAEWLVDRPAPQKTWPWAVAAGLAALALVVQSIHFWHEELAGNPTLEPLLKSVYAALGDPIPEEWDVHAYRVAKDMISNHPGDAGALLVNASVANDAPRPQPYPLLKITLLDRWGDPIGERFFAPGEYLQSRDQGGQLLDSGASAEASVLIVDPGDGAVSYGIDACLRHPDNRLWCAHENDY